MRARLVRGSAWSPSHRECRGLPSKTFRRASHRWDIPLTPPRRPPRSTAPPPQRRCVPSAPPKASRRATRLTAPHGVRWSMPRTNSVTARSTCACPISTARTCRHCSGHSTRWALPAASTMATLARTPRRRCSSSRKRRPLRRWHGVPGHVCLRQAPSPCLGG